MLTKFKFSAVLFLIIAIALVSTTAAFAGRPTCEGDSQMGYCDEKVDKYDQDGNGIPDEGVVVSGHFTSLYAEDASGAYYWDLGDGRVYTSVGVTSIDDLEGDTLTVCDYVNNYRGTFENDPYQDTGWIQNHIICTGYEKAEYNYLMVHESDPRYTGNPDWALWGTWEYHVLTVSGSGNLVKARPQQP